MSDFFKNLFLFLVSLVFACLFVGTGWTLGYMLEMDSKFLAITFIVACFVFMYMKYVTQLRLENQSLRIIRDMIEKLPDNLKKAARSDDLGGPAQPDDVEEPIAPAESREEPG